MEDLDLELWKLGVFAKTEHNEVAPAQHEIAPVYTNANTATEWLKTQDLLRLLEENGTQITLFEA